MRNEDSGSIRLIVFAVLAIGVLTVMGVVGSYYSGSLREAQAGDGCEIGAGDCGPCQECKDQYPDKPFEVLGCVDVCAVGEECIDGDCCPSGRCCDDVCCDEGEECTDDGCCPEEQECNDKCCGEETDECINGAFCPEDRACDDECCPEGYICLD